MLALRVLGRPAGHRPGAPVSLSGGRDSRAPPHRPSWLGAPLLAWCAGGGCVPRPHQTRQVLAAPLLCSAKEQKRDSQQGHALGSSWSCVPPTRRAVDGPQQPWLGAGLDGASSTCHPVAEALCSGCTRCFWMMHGSVSAPSCCAFTHRVVNLKCLTHKHSELSIHPEYPQSRLRNIPEGPHSEL